MTDPPRPPILQPVHGSNHVPYGNDVIAPTPTIPSVPSLTNGTSIEEEEAFTIKCICQYPEDDGSTVLCEGCNTWQHLDCYYEKGDIPGEDDAHSCVDCEPRLLDSRRADDIQRGKRASIDQIDRKIKKPVKSHKKKVKPIDPSSVVWSDRHELASPRNGVPKDQKKPKAVHKHSNSVHASSNNIPKLVPRRSASQSLPSPPKIGDGLELTGEPYSKEFMHLYDDDPGASSMKGNLYNNIGVTTDLATWSDDVDALAGVTNGKKHPEVFLRTGPIESLPRPQLTKHIKEDQSREFHGRHPKWIYLTSESPLVRESFVGELRGKIGAMKDYVKEEVNRWEYLRHPLPFVFFHPMLPIYIDTRQEGSLVRYLRRSCQPNLGLKTFLDGDSTNGSNYYFGFVATRDIEAGVELTIPWTTDEHVRAFTQQNYGGIKSENYAETDENYVLSYFSKVFADFGGCACEATEECAINKLARRLRALTADIPVANGKKRGRKPKDAGLSRTNASRSGSEAIRYKEDDDEDDAHSTSTGSHSKPHSRDMTPQDSKPQQPSGSEISEREKRKIAAMVERIDQDKGQPVPKKKKRTSGQSAPTSKSESTRIDTIPTRPRMADSNGKKNSGSPTTKTTFSMSPLPSGSSVSPINKGLSQIKPGYANASTQTDPDSEDWMTCSGEAQRRKPFVSLKKKLLMRAHSERSFLDEQRKSSTPTPNGISTIKFENTAPFEPVLKDGDGDLLMDGEDRSPMASPIGSVVLDTKTQVSDAATHDMAQQTQTHIPPLHPPPIPYSNSTSPTTNGFGRAEMRIPLPPNIITNGVAGGPATFANSPVVQSPSVLLTPSNGSLISPSPAKKKLSLGDYMTRFTKPETPMGGTAKDKDKEGEGSPISVVTPSDLRNTPTIEQASEEVVPPNTTEATIPIDPDLMEVDSKS